MSPSAESIDVKMVRVEGKLDTLITQQSDYYTQLKEVRSDLRELELQFKSMQSVLKLIGTLLGILVPTILAVAKFIWG